MKLAVEAIRGCGYRTIGSLYLIGVGAFAACDRFPMKVQGCSCCGNKPRFNRGISRINPQAYFKDHFEIDNVCRDVEGCFVCYPPDEDFHALMWVGKEYYTTQSFTQEVKTMGFSKKIATIPKWFKNKKTIVYLAQQSIIDESESWSPGQGQKKFDGIFMAIRVTGIDYIMPESEKHDKKKIRELEDHGITPVFVPDNDSDHRPTKKRYKPLISPKATRPKERRIQKSLDEWI